MSVEMPDLPGLRKSEREFYGQYVVGERQRWREFIRTQVDSMQDIVNSVITQGGASKADIAAIRKIRTALAVRFSPELGKPDSELLEEINSLVSCIAEDKKPDDLQDCLNKVVDGISWLLKEDWERVKHEVRPIWRTWEPRKLVHRKEKKIDEEPSCWVNIRRWFASVCFVFVVFIAWQWGEHKLLPSDSCDSAMECSQKPESDKKAEEIQSSPIAITVTGATATVCTASNSVHKPLGLKKKLSEGCSNNQDTKVP